MNIWLYMVLNGIIFSIILTSYLLLVMRIYSPRIWGFEDYPKTITDTVNPQTKEEKKKQKIIFVPFILFGIGYPIISTIFLNIQLGGAIDFLSAFINIFGIIMFGNFADLLILDILIVGTITPQFVIIPGTEHLKNTEYKAFRKMHAKGHAWGTILLAGISFIMALIIFLL